MPRYFVHQKGCKTLYNLVSEALFAQTKLITSKIWKIVFKFSLPFLMMMRKKAYQRVVKCLCVVVFVGLFVFCFVALIKFIKRLQLHIHLITANQ